jgi:hypothetical protein
MDMLELYVRLRLIIVHPVHVFMETVSMELGFLHVIVVGDTPELCAKHRSTTVSPVLEDQIHVFTGPAIMESDFILVLV